MGTERGKDTSIILQIIDDTSIIPSCRDAIGRDLSVSLFGQQSSLPPIGCLIEPPEPWQHEEKMSHL